MNRKASWPDRSKMTDAVEKNSLESHARVLRAPASVVVSARRRRRSIEQRCEALLARGGAVAARSVAGICFSSDIASLANSQIHRTLWGGAPLGAPAFVAAPELEVAMKAMTSARSCSVSSPGNGILFPGTSFCGSVR
jgi:hypothetical protein